MQEVSTVRLYVLRAAYLVVLLGLAIFIWPLFFTRGPTLSHMHGVVCAMLSTVALLAALGLRYSLRMLPVLLFELIWKTLWLLVVALPLWMSGQPLEPAFAGIVMDNLFGLVIFSIAIPWGFVWHKYLKLPGDRFKRRSLA